MRVPYLAAVPTPHMRKENAMSISQERRDELDGKARELATVDAIEHARRAAAYDDDAAYTTLATQLGMNLEEVAWYMQCYTKRFVHQFGVSYRYKAKVQAATRAGIRADRERKQKREQTQ
jgi:NADH:ubiquinone oxidoreductase subunit E